MVIALPLVRYALSTLPELIAPVPVLVSGTDVDRGAAAAIWLTSVIWTAKPDAPLTVGLTAKLSPAAAWPLML